MKSQTKGRRSGLQGLFQRAGHTGSCNLGMYVCVVGGFWTGGSALTQEGELWAGTSGPSLRATSLETPSGPGRCNGGRLSLLMLPRAAQEGSRLPARLASASCSGGFALQEWMETLQAPSAAR